MKREVNLPKYQIVKLHDFCSTLTIDLESIPGNVTRPFIESNWWVQHKVGVVVTEKKTLNESFRGLGASRNLKFSFSSYCCVVPTEMKECV